MLVRDAGFEVVLTGLVVVVVAAAVLGVVAVVAVVVVAGWLVEHTAAS